MCEWKPKTVPNLGRRVLLGSWVWKALRPRRRKCGKWLTQMRLHRSQVAKLRALFTFLLLSPLQARCLRIQITLWNKHFMLDNNTAITLWNIELWARSRHLLYILKYLFNLYWKNYIGHKSFLISCTFFQMGN